MAKKHKNLENIPIQWDGDLSHPEAGNQGQSIPASVDLGKWAGEYIPCWSENYTDCVFEDMLYFEDFDIRTDSFTYIPNGILNVDDATGWVAQLPAGDNATNIVNFVVAVSAGNTDAPPKAPVSAYTGGTPYTWGDVNFIIEIADGIGTGSRRARENRLNKFDDEKKKKLIHLICRVKGKKVYDEKKEIGDVQIKLEDAELVIERVLGKIKVEKVDVL